MDMVEKRSFIGKEFIYSTSDSGKLTAYDNGEIQIKNRSQPKRMLYPEYSINFPHRKGTLGFSGIHDPKGMNLFINIDDNSEKRINESSVDIYQHEMYPCFANIVTGTDIIKKAMRRVDERSLQFVIQNVQIVKRKRS